MSVTTFSIRVDAEVKREFDKFCENVGMNTTTAINLFLRSVIREQRLPFEITTKPDPFYAAVNQSFLHESIAQLEHGEGETYRDVGEILSERS
jgi:DNA-damage-inducible protein J